MADRLKGKKIAILVEEGFEQVELTKPLQALKDEGAEAHIISPNKNSEIKAWNHTDWGETVKVDRKISDDMKVLREKLEKKTTGNIKDTLNKST